MISKTEEYALRAAVHLARHASEHPCRAHEIAEKTGIPANYLSKVLHQLARTGLVTSERGRGGGFRLARAPGRIRLGEVVKPFESAEDWRRCVLGRPECSDGHPCGAHEAWKKVRAARERFFAKTTLADVLDDPSAGASAPS